MAVPASAEDAIAVEEAAPRKRAPRRKKAAAASDAAAEEEAAEVWPSTLLARWILLSHPFWPPDTQGCKLDSEQQDACQCCRPFIGDFLL